ncbi:MAG TPA: sigma-70 family RNA polymerase sigma factor [Chitinophagales bacterium]|nr:sigma-70 family RNA polymerase sigma factor [Chitinophagales bacterium]HLP49970.1 sigma-70 family RNA polymerase sigma factor [Chitinophagales bacterium]
MDLNSKFSARAQEDLELVDLAKKGDQVAFGKLMARYRDSIFFMVLKMVHNRDDAEDLTLEAFGKAFNSISNYSADFAFSTWLFKIATNNSIDFIRKKKLQTTSLDQTTSTEDGEITPIAVKDHSSNPEEAMVKEQRAAKIRLAIEQLSPKYRALIELRYLDELAYEEIAEKLDIPLGTVKAQLFRAKDMLYNILKVTKEKY